MNAKKLLHAVIALAAAAGAALGVTTARASIEDEIEFYDLGMGQDKATIGRERALEKGQGKGLEKAPPMTVPPPPPPPPPLDPPPGL